jgi:hypothetical protein
LQYAKVARVARAPGRGTPGGRQSTGGPSADCGRRFAAQRVEHGLVRDPADEAGAAPVEDGQPCPFGAGERVEGAYSSAASVTAAGRRVATVTVLSRWFPSARVSAAERAVAVPR